MPSKAMKLAGVVAMTLMTLVLALGGGAALVEAEDEDAAYSVAQGEGPATSRP